MNIGTFISGSDKLSLEQRIFNSASFFMALVALSACVVHVAYGSSLALLTAVGISGVVFCGIFYLSRFKRNFLVSSTWFVIFGIAFADFLWVYTFEQKSTISFLYLFLFFLMLTVKPGRSHFRFAGIFLLNLVFMQVLLKYLNISNELVQSGYFNIPVSYYLALFILAFAFVGSYFKVSYEKDRLELQQKNRKVKNVNNGLNNRNQHLVSFAHMVSHNLRSPVAGMKMLLNLYDMAKTEAEKEELVSHLKEGAFELFDMVEDLSTVMKDYTKLDQKAEEIMLDEILHKTKSTLAGQIKESNAIITADFEIDVVKYLPIYLESIFLNLISNSLKYASPDRTPKIHVKSYMENYAVMLSFTDNGMGIDTVKNERQLFKMYKTFHRDEQKDSKGIGLFLTKNQIEMLGGKINLESTLGQGSTFSIELYRI